MFRTANRLPFAAANKHGEVLDLKDTITELAEQVKLITDLVEWEITDTNRETVAEFLAQEYYTRPDGTRRKVPKQNNAVARLLGFSYPKEFIPAGKSGISRLDKIYGAKLISELKSWHERAKAAKGETDKYVTQGWKRTASTAKPRNLNPKINLADSDSSYCKIKIDQDILILEMVINGNWTYLLFDYDEVIRRADRIAPPSIFIDAGGKLKFSFPMEFEDLRPEFSSRYVIGVDVGVNDYAVVSVLDVVSDQVVYQSTLSRRVHSLYNKVKKAKRQVAAIQRKGRKQEADRHRESNNRRKRELAIIAAQEIAEISFDFSNALVAFEDLSWIENTMQHGRWNRGELVKRTTDMLEINGGRVLKVSAYMTSKLCSTCGTRLAFHSWKIAYCPTCSKTWDRDVNASINIAKRIAQKGTMQKCIATRKRTKNTSKQKKRTKNGSGQPIKYPGRDRTKTGPTPKRPVRKTTPKEVTQLLCSARHNDDGTRVVLDGRMTSVFTPMTVKSSTNLLYEKLLF